MSELGFDQEERLHPCRFCDKTFFTGQALGGHMRSHPSPKSPSQIQNSPQKRIIKRKSLENDDDYLIVKAAGCLMLLSCDKKFENFDPFGGKQFNFETELIDNNQLNREKMMKKLKKVKSLKRGKKKCEKSKVKSLNEAGQYECATCQRTFDSFQALGGHMASHRKSI